MSPQTPEVTHPVDTGPSTQEAETRTGKQLETALTVIQTGENGTRTIDPIRAKALLTRFTITHQQGHTYTVADQTSKYTANRDEGTCTCPSTLPKRNKQCEHLQHLEERANREELRTPNGESASITTESKQDNSAQMQNNETSDPGTVTLTCDECSRGIGHTDYFHGAIDYATCNVCALENHSIYYLDTDGSDDHELVRFEQLLTNTAAASYYHENGVMSVYDFFEDHPDTEPDDSVITVSQRLDAPNCTGLLFDSDTIAVPGTVLTKAVETMDSQETAEQENIPDDTEFNIVRGFESYTNTPPAALKSQNTAPGAPANE